VPTPEATLPIRPLTPLRPLAMTALSAAENKPIVWKLADIRAGGKKRLAQGFKRLAEWAKAITMTVGLRK
jgi:hypothetical protein